MSSEIVFAGTHWEAGLVRSILENQGIRAYLLDEHNGVNAPWQVTAGGLGAVKVSVSGKDVVKAKYIVQKFYENRSNDDKTF